MNDGTGESSQDPMVFGLDYDGTYSRDPEFWDAFVKLAKARGHKVHCVTCRRETEENVAECSVPGLLTYFTGLAAKSWFMEKRGIYVDVWIDNEVGGILYGR